MHENCIQFRKNYAKSTDDKLLYASKSGNFGLNEGCYNGLLKFNSTDAFVADTFRRIPFHFAKNTPKLAKPRATKNGFLLH